MYSTTHCLFCTIMSERRSWNTALTFSKNVAICVSSLNVIACCCCTLLLLIFSVLDVSTVHRFQAHVCKKNYLFLLSLFQKICPMHTCIDECDIQTAFTWCFPLSFKSTYQTATSYIQEKEMILTATSQLITLLISNLYRLYKTYP